MDIFSTIMNDSVNVVKTGVQMWAGVTAIDQSKIFFAMMIASALIFFWSKGFVNRLKKGSTEDTAQNTEGNTDNQTAVVAGEFITPFYLVKMVQIACSGVFCFAFIKVLQLILLASFTPMVWAAATAFNFFK